MTAVGPAYQRQQRRRAVLASYFGSVLEYYDFFLYATTAAIVFNVLFFTDLDPLVGTIASFGTLAAGYVARPLGGLVFGHFGDRLGRKAMLIWTVSLMGVASTLIGLLPTYDQIGLLAPILLVALRVVQGLSLGGEWAGAILMSTEHSKGRRGLWASIVQAGGPSGMVLSTIVLALVSALTTQEQFLAWGWRIPFLLSIVLVAIALLIRFKVDESPVFVAEVRNAPRTVRVPMIGLLRRYWKALILLFGVAVSSSVAAALLATYVISYAVGQGHSQQTLLNVLALSSFLSMFTMVAYGTLSDRVGRRPVIIVGCVGMIIVSFALFPIVDSGSVLALIIAIPVSHGLISTAVSGPLGSLLSEHFPTEHRYTGASIAFQFSGVVGGLVPLVLAWAFYATGGSSTLPMSLILSAVFVIAVICLILLKDAHKDSLGARADETGPQFTGADTVAAPPHPREPETARRKDPTGSAGGTP